MKKQFINFLKRKGALIPFICNLRLSNLTVTGILLGYSDAKPSASVTLSEYIHANEGWAENMLWNSFTWRLTTEGHGYWNALHEEWEDMI